MKTTLKNISYIQTGLFAKTSLEGDIAYLQVKDFDANKILKPVLFPELVWEKNIERHFLENGNIVFASKGSNNFAATFKQSYLPCVASSSFFVIRLRSFDVLPEYVSWFINQPSAQNYLKGSATGTAIASISKSVLEDLVIPVPSIQKQKTILKVDQLFQKEKQLRAAIQTQREQLIQHQLTNLLK